MFNVDPKISFWIGLTIFVCGAIAAGGTSFFSGALPDWIIPPLVKWCLIISTLGNGVMTYIAGSNMTNAGRIANVQQVPLPQKLDSLVAHNPEVKGVVTTQAVANATSSEKVISG
jgi:hypothetical protein